MRTQIALFIGILFFASCGEEKKSNVSSVVAETNADAEQVVDVRTESTLEMVSILEDIKANNDPLLNLYDSKGRVPLIEKQLSDDPKKRFSPTWFGYCQDLIRAGDPEKSIEEFERYFDMSIPLADQIDHNNKLIVLELMALAYLRIGEEENCRNAHTEFSCILPLEEPGVHQLKEGSTKAIELYQIAYDKNPQDYQKWLINLGYMTLGNHAEEVPEKYAIPFPNWKMEEEEFPRFKEIAMNVGVAQNGLAGGACVEDFNNDGLLDIFATAFGIDEQARLFINNGKGGFDETTESAGLKGIFGGLNCLQADYDNDGNIDILILRGAWLEDAGKWPNSLLRNNGDGTFSDVTKEAGILSYFPTQTATWGDYNKDGNLDLFVAHESSPLQTSPCFLYENNGDGTFKDVSQDVGLGEVKGFIKGTVWGDIDNDGWPELYISVYDRENLLYKNENGVFTEMAKKAGVSEPIHSFPCWFWDVNNDGYQDLFVSGYDMAYPHVAADVYAKELQNKKTEISHPRLYINNKNGTFSEKTSTYNISRAMYPMGCNYGDLDNDGYLDFYLATGCPDYSAIVPNRMFRNVGGKKFEEVTSSGGFGHIQKGHAVSFADIDQDGDQDIYTVMGGAYNSDDFNNVLFENPGFGNNWIILELEGTKTNRSAIGTRIEVELDNGQKIYRIVSTGSSFGANCLRQEIGLGQAKKIASITIDWLNSEVQVLEDVAVNQKIKIKEGNAGFEALNHTYIPFAQGSGEHVHQH